MFGRNTYVKSPVASLTLACSSVRKRVKVTMSVLMPADSVAALSPFGEAILSSFGVLGTVCYS